MVGTTDASAVGGLWSVLRRAGALVLTVLAFALLVRCAGPGGSDAQAPGSPDGAHVAALLEAVTVVDERVSMPGYERSCSGGAGCVFGPAWSDHTDAPGAGNGCDTRNDVLAVDLLDPVVGPDCRVLSGMLHDPYTGRAEEFTRAEGAKVHVDHVYALAAAWDMGAHSWPQRLRERFANDTDFNLLAVGAKVNQEKADLTPGQWLPEPVAYRCFYLAKYAAVAIRYDLPVTAEDHRVMTAEAARC